jgi:hypothetical protein
MVPPERALPLGAHYRYGALPGDPRSAASMDPAVILSTHLPPAFGRGPEFLPHATASDRPPDVLDA